MGLTSTSTGAGAADTALVLRRERPDDRIVALAGNPNVGIRNLILRKVY